MIKNFINTVKRFKAFTLLNVIGLTVAFLAFMVVVMQVEVELTHDSSYTDSERIYVIQHESSWEPGSWTALSPKPLYFNTSSIVPQIEQVSSRGFSSIIFGGERYKFESTTGTSTAFNSSISRISRSFVDMFDMQIVQGTIGGDNDPWLIIPESMAKKHFPDGSAVGRMLSMVGQNDQGKVVSAVYRDFPSNSSFSNEICINIGNDEASDWGNSNYRVYVKLPTEALVADVEQKLGDYIAQNKMTNKMRLMPIEDLYFSTDAESMDGDVASGSSRESLMIFLLIAVLIVVVAAINYLNFAAALVPTRITGVNTRKIFGATNFSIRMQFISESVLMCFVSFVLAAGVLLSFETLESVSFISTTVIVSEHILSVVALTALVALAVGLLAGLYPAFYSTSIETCYALKGSFALSGKGRALRTALVGLQYLFSIVLITIAIVMNLQYGVLSKSEMGFDRQNILTMTSPGSQASFISELRSHSDILDVTYSNNMPFFTDENMSWRRPYKDSSINFDVVNVHSSFPSFFGIKIVEGEDFKPSDDQSEQHSSLLFNQTAQKLYGIKAGEEVGGMRVVGIMRDFNYQPLQSSIAPMAFSVIGNFFEQYAQYASDANIYVRCQGSDYASLIAFIRAKGVAINPDWDGNIVFMDSRINEMYQKEARTISQINISSAIAVIISLLGVFGLIHFEMQRRRKEISLRKINGATIRTVLILFNRRFVWIVGVCFVIAAPVAWWVAVEWLSDFAYRTPVYWWIFALALLVVLLITILTVTLQSLRAASENPVKALKSE